MASISVVIPAHNAGRFLGEALTSVGEQTFRPAEVIVVDDGSTDGTAALARQAGARVVPLGGNSGPARARNRGVEAASGEWLAFLDADDRWDADHLATLGRLLEAHPECVLAFAPVRSFGRFRGENPLPVAPEQPLKFFTTLLQANFISQSAVLLRRAAFLAAGGYDETLRHGEDLDLWLRLARAGPFICAPSSTGSLRSHAANTSLDQERMLRGAWDARLRARAALLGSGATPEALAAADQALRWSLEATLRAAWRAPGDGPLRAALEVASSVPGADAIRARWLLRARLRPAWKIAAAAWRTIPAEWRRRLGRWRQPWQEVPGFSGPAGRGNPGT